MKLTISLVVYNGAKYLPLLFDSLKKQTFTDWTINVLDNNSTDDTLKILNKSLNSLGVQYNLIKSDKNIGFSRGHNKLFKRVSSDYYLILNDDVYLDQDCLEQMVNFLDNDRSVAVSPRLMKWDFSKEKKSFTNVIDSLGLKVLRNRRVVEMGVGKRWRDDIIKKNKSNSIEVFGLSATCMMLSKNKIDELCYSDGNMYDEDYFMYKEDVDLAYRLQQVGLRTSTILDAVAWHDRSGHAGSSLADYEAAKNKKSQPWHIKVHSYRNHLATLIKNEYWQNFVLDFPWIVWYELKKFGYFLIFDIRVLVVFLQLLGQIGSLLRKRTAITKSRAVDYRVIRKWWM